MGVCLWVCFKLSGAARGFLRARSTVEMSEKCRDSALYAWPSKPGVAGSSPAGRAKFVSHWDMRDVAVTSDGARLMRCGESRPQACRTISACLFVWGLLCKSHNCIWPGHHGDVGDGSEGSLCRITGTAWWLVAGVAFLDAAIAAGLSFAADLAALSDLLGRETLQFGSSIPVRL